MAAADKHVTTVSPAHKKPMKTALGYTLIELIIVIAIMSLLVGVGVAGYRDFSRRQDVQNSARTLIADLRVAQGAANSGEKPTGCNALNGVVVDVTSATSYTLCYACNVNYAGQSCSQLGFTMKQVTTPAGTSLSVVGTQPILFRVLGRGTNLNATTTINVTSGTSGATRAVTVNPGGRIE